MPTVKQILDELPQRFRPGAARGMNAVIELDLSGENGGRYHAIIRDGTIEVREGPHRSPHMTLAMKAEDYVALATGQLTSQMAFMTGRLRITGDMGLAVKMPELLGIG